MILIAHELQETLNEKYAVDHRFGVRQEMCWVFSVKRLTHKKVCPSTVLFLKKLIWNYWIQIQNIKAGVLSLSRLWHSNLEICTPKWTKWTESLVRNRPRNAFVPLGHSLLWDATRLQPRTDRRWTKCSRSRVSWVDVLSCVTALGTLSPVVLVRTQVMNGCSATKRQLPIVDSLPQSYISCHTCGFSACWFRFQRVWYWGDDKDCVRGQGRSL